MTTELGLNLAGVERVLELEEQLERASRRLEALERRSAEMRAEMEAEIERVRKSFKAELVPYKGHHRPHPRRRRPPAAAVDPRRARQVVRLRS
jgi:MerR family transcriptional regulator/heat shock protein HspR